MKKYDAYLFFGKDLVPSTSRQKKPRFGMDRRFKL